MFRVFYTPLKDGVSHKVMDIAVKQLNKLSLLQCHCIDGDLDMDRYVADNATGARL